MNNPDFILIMTEPRYRNSSTLSRPSPSVALRKSCFSFVLATVSILDIWEPIFMLFLYLSWLYAGIGVYELLLNQNKKKEKKKKWREGVYQNYAACTPRISIALIQAIV